MTRKVTYKNLSHWYEELRKYRPDIPCFLVANKIDGEVTCVAVWTYMHMRTLYSCMYVHRYMYLCVYVEYEYIYTCIYVCMWNMNISNLSCYIFSMVYTISVLFSPHYWQYIYIYIGVLHKHYADVTRSDIPWGSKQPSLLYPIHY